MAYSMFDEYVDQAQEAMEDDDTFGMDGHTYCIKEAIAEQRYLDCHPDVEICQCKGTGWWSTSWDTYEHCIIHYKGQIHPEYFMDMRQEMSDKEAEEAQQQAMNQWAHRFDPPIPTPRTCELPVKSNDFEDPFADK